MTVLGTPGATVYLDNKDIGRIPFTTNFDHYGKREFRIVKPGHETKTELVQVSAPWYQWVGIDFVAEVLLPGKLTDHKYYEFNLQPERVVQGSEIVSRAKQLQQTAHADGVPRIGASPLLTPAPPVGDSTITSPAFAPIVPSETQFTPPDPNMFVPPTLQPTF